MKAFVHCVFDAVRWGDCFYDLFISYVNQCWHALDERRRGEKKMKTHEEVTYGKKLLHENMINGRIAARECVCVFLVPDEQNTYASLIKKMIFLSILSLCVLCCSGLSPLPIILLLCFHHHHSFAVIPHTVSFFYSLSLQTAYVRCCRRLLSFCNLLSAF